MSAGATATTFDHETTPLTLVYEHAVTKNERGRFSTHPVDYILNGLKIVANVYTPANYDSSKKHAAIVVAHPNAEVKEQTAGLDAERLAEPGYIIIAMDAEYQGGSDGEPRSRNKPQVRIEDIHGAADFITQYSGVDAKCCASRTSAEAAGNSAWYCAEVTPAGRGHHSMAWSPARRSRAHWSHRGARLRQTERPSNWFRNAVPLRLT